MTTIVRKLLGLYPLDVDCKISYRGVDVPSGEGGVRSANSIDVCILCRDHCSSMSRITGDLLVRFARRERTWRRRPCRKRIPGFMRWSPCRRDQILAGHRGLVVVRCRPPAERVGEP
jgi:hypothetical protein